MAGHRVALPVAGPALIAILERERALYSAKVLEEARHPRNMGGMLEPDGHALVCGPCGDTMEMFLRIQDLRIEVAAFMTDGCGPTVACGSMLTRMALGKSLAELNLLGAQRLNLVQIIRRTPPAEEGGEPEVTKIALPAGGQVLHEGDEIDVIGPDSELVRYE